MPFIAAYPSAAPFIALPGSNCQELELPDPLLTPVPNELLEPPAMFMPTFMPLLKPLDWFELVPIDDPSVVGPPMI